MLSHVWLFCDLMDSKPPDSSVHGISRQENWSGLPFPAPGESSQPGDGTCVSYISCIGIVNISHVNKLMLKIPQARFQQCVNWELPDIQARFRKGKGTRDQIANIHSIKEKAKTKQTNFCSIHYVKAFGNKLWKILQEMGSSYLPLEKLVCMTRSNS